MTLHIDNPEANQLAHELSSRMGKSVEEVVLEALRTQASYIPLISSQTHQDSNALYDKIMEISRRCAALPTHDTRSADEILGYDENGLPT